MQFKRKKLIAGLCAASVVFSSAGGLPIKNENIFNADIPVSAEEKKTLNITASPKDNIIYDGSSLDISDFTFDGEDVSLINNSNTTITIEQLLNTIQSANSENYMRSNIYKIYHSLDNTGFKIVLPSSGDLTTIFGINNNYSGTPVESTWLKTYEAIVETLNNANYNYMSMTRYLTEYLNSVDLAGYNIPSYHPCTTEPTDNILFFFIYNTTWNTDSLYCYTVEYLNDNTYNITAAWNANGTGSWFKAIGSASTKLFGEMQNLTGPDNAVNRWRFANTRFLPFLEIK